MCLNTKFLQFAYWKLRNLMVFLVFLGTLSWKIYGIVDKFVNSSFLRMGGLFFIGMDFYNGRNDFKEGGKNSCGKNLVASICVTNRAAKLEET